MYELSIWTVLLLALAAGAAGWVDAVSGGGGLLQLPALFIALPAGSEVEGSTHSRNDVGSVGGEMSLEVTDVLKAEQKRTSHTHLKRASKRLRAAKAPTRR